MTSPIDSEAPSMRPYDSRLSFGERPGFTRESLVYCLGETAVRFVEIVRDIPKYNQTVDGIYDPWKGIGAFALEATSASGQQSNPNRATNPLHSITPEQEDLVTMFCEKGMSSVEIARYYRQTPQAIHKSLANIYKLVGAKNKAELAAHIPIEPSDYPDATLKNMNQLTPKQVEVFARITRGESIAEIKNAMKKSRTAIGNLIERGPYQKLGLSSTLEVGRVGLFLKDEVEGKIRQIVERPYTLPTINELKRSRLNERETEVIKLLSAGFSTDDIAEKLRVPKALSYRIISSINKKLEAPNRRVAVAIYNRPDPEKTEQILDYHKNLGTSALREAIAVFGLPIAITPEDLFKLTPIQRELLFALSTGNAEEAKRTLGEEKYNDHCLEIIGRLGIQAAILQPIVQANERAISEVAGSALFKANLTPRQMEALMLALDGWTSDQIARNFGITTSTINVRLRRAYKKLGVSDIYQASALVDPISAEYAQALNPKKKLNGKEFEVFQMIADFPASNTEISEALDLHPYDGVTPMKRSIRNKLGLKNNLELVRASMAFIKPKKERMVEDFNTNIRPIIEKTAQKLVGATLDPVANKRIVAVLKCNNVDTVPELVVEGKSTTAGLILALMFKSQHGEALKDPQMLQLAKEVIVEEIRAVQAEQKSAEQSLVA